jgi:hypothetical protein
MRYYDEDDEEIQMNYNLIQVHLDKTESPQVLMITKEIFETYKRFSERIMSDCGKSKKAGSSPMDFEALFGSFQFSMTISFCIGTCVM